MSRAAVALLSGWLACAALAACGGPRRDGFVGPPDTLRGVVVLEIGEAEGADEYLLASVAGPTADSLGRIYVPDVQLGEVRAYGPDGRFLFRVAREGAGPGEVRRPCCLGWDDRGRLWVRDGGNARYQAYRVGPRGATYDEARRFHHADRNYAAALTFDTAGHLVDVGHTPGATPMAAQLARFHLAPDGTVADSEVVAEPSADSTDVHVVERGSADRFVRMYAYQPFGSVGLVAHGPGGAWATAASGYYVVRWVRPDGSALVVARDDPGPPLTGDDVRWAAENLAETADWLGTTVPGLPFGVPDRKAPVQDLWFDQAGRLWVRRTTSTSTEPDLADVYDAAGAVVAVARWPRGVDLRLGYVTDSVAVGVRRDSLGVPRVTVLRWSRGEMR
jgi:hypothetical protein